MSEEEREFFRKRAQEMRQRAKLRVQEALDAAGVSLDPEARKAFFEAYLEGRREIERELRAKMAEERKIREEELLEKLLEKIHRNPTN